MNLEYPNIEIKNQILINGDCLEVMDKLIRQDIKFDAIITDIPYGQTECSFDNQLELAKMWNLLNNISKTKTPILLFATQPFTTKLIYSNIKRHKFNWIWNKNNSAGFACIKYKPFVITEDICVFNSSDKAHNYYPIMEERGKLRDKGGYSKSENYIITPIKNNQKNNLYYPKNILNFSNASQNKKNAPTTKTNRTNRILN